MYNAVSAKGISNQSCTVSGYDSRGQAVPCNVGVQVRSFLPREALEVVARFKDLAASPKFEGECSDP